MAKAKAQFKFLGRKTAQCQKLIKLRLHSAKISNCLRAVVENLLQVMQDILNKLAFHKTAKLEHCRQLVESERCADKEATAAAQNLELPN